MGYPHMPRRSQRDEDRLLNERPAFVLFLAARGRDIPKEPIGIYGSDPYVVGGHTHADTGDIERYDGARPVRRGRSGRGQSNKFVGAAPRKASLAPRGAVKYMASATLPDLDTQQVESEKARVFAPLLRGPDFDGVSQLEMEERMQRLMDEYAGGTSQFYRTNEERLDYALRHLNILREQTRYLYVGDLHDLMNAHEVIDRLDVAEVLVHHLKGRKETRWKGWQTRSDYPDTDPNFDCFVETRRNRETGESKPLRVLTSKLSRGTVTTT